MVCETCKDTDFIVSGTSQSIYDINGTKCKIFVDLRMDRENNELDMDFGLVNVETNEIIQDSIEWSNAIEIKHCPVCGKELD